MRYEQLPDRPKPGLVLYCPRCFHAEPLHGRMTYLSSISRGQMYLGGVISCPRCRQRGEGALLRIGKLVNRYVPVPLHQASEGPIRCP